MGRRQFSYLFMDQWVHAQSHNTVDEYCCALKLSVTNLDIAATITFYHWLQHVPVLYTVFTVFTQYSFSIHSIYSVISLDFPLVSV